TRKAHLYPLPTHRPPDRHSPSVLMGAWGHEDHVNVQGDTRGPRPLSEGDDDRAAARGEHDLGQAPLLVWQQTEVLGGTCAFGIGGEGPTVVFLHGWGLSGPAYRAP